MISKDFKAVNLFIFLVLATLVAGTEVSNAKPKLRRPKTFSVSSHLSKDGSEKSQTIRTKNGALIIWKKGREVTKSIVVTKKYQITKLGNSDGQFQFINISKKAKKGNLILSLQYNRRNKKYVARNLSFRPYRSYTGLSYCEAGELTKQTTELIDEIKQTEITDLEKEILASKSIDPTCANLSEPEKTNFFKGLALAHSAREERNNSIERCLEDSDKTYTSLMDYIFSGIYGGRDDLKIECKSLPNKLKALYQGGETDKIAFDTTSLKEKTPEEIAKLVTHEVVHVAYDKMLNSGVDGIPAGDPHLPIRCCLEDEYEIDTCLNDAAYLRWLVEDQLLEMKGIPTIAEYFSNKFEFTEGDVAAVKDAEAAYKALLNDFFEGNPQCTKGTLSTSCSKNLTSQLETFQENWMKDYCSDKNGNSCSKVTKYNVNISAAVATYKAALTGEDSSPKPDPLSTQPRTEANGPIVNPDKLDTHYEDAAGTIPIEIPTSNSVRHETFRLSELADAVEIYDPDFVGPQAQTLEASTNTTIKAETSFSEKVMENLTVLPRASADSSMQASTTSTKNSINAQPVLPSTSPNFPTTSFPTASNRKPAGAESLTPTIPFQNLSSAQQVSAITSAAEGIGPYSNVTKKDANVPAATNLPRTASVEPNQRIPLGSQAQAPTQSLARNSSPLGRSPSSTSTSSSDVIPSAPSSASTAPAAPQAAPSERDSKPAAPRPAQKPITPTPVSPTVRTAQARQQFEKGTLKWAPNYATDPDFAEFRSYLRRQNIDIVLDTKKDTRVFNLKNATRLYTIGPGGVLVPFAGPAK